MFNAMQSLALVACVGLRFPAFHLPGPAPFPFHTRPADMTANSKAWWLDLTYSVPADDPPILHGRAKAGLACQPPVTVATRCHGPPAEPHDSSLADESAAGMPASDDGPWLRAATTAAGGGGCAAAA